MKSICKTVLSLCGLFVISFTSVRAQLQFPELILDNDGLELEASYEVTFADQFLEPSEFTVKRIENNTGLIAPNGQLLDDFNLFNTPLDEEKFYADQGYLVEFEDNTAVVMASFQGDVDTEHKFTAYYHLHNGGSWEEISSSTSGNPVGVRNDHGHNLDLEELIFYLINSSESFVYGAEGLEGSLLQISHAPANNYYYYQVGIGTTARPSDYGGSGWCYLEGELIQVISEDESVVTPIIAQGGFDHVFNPYYGQVVLRTYTITDENGNEFTQEMYKVLEPACLGDFDLSGLITSADLSFILADYGCLVNCPTDLSGDGAILVNDISIFLASFGVPCE